MGKLYLIRHGESIANSRNILSGTLDVALTKNGIKQAIHTGRLLKKIKFDEVYTSLLSRAFVTAMIILSENKNNLFPIVYPSEGEKNLLNNSFISNNLIKVYKDDRLNERFYGNLQGITVEEELDLNGKTLWQLSFDEIDSAESINDTIKRTKSFYNDIIVPKLSQDKNLLVVSHGTCLSTLLMHIENISLDDAINNLLPNSKPIVFSFENNLFRREEF